MNYKLFIKNKKSKLKVIKTPPSLFAVKFKLSMTNSSVNIDDIEKVINELQYINYNLVDQRYKESLEDFTSLLGDGAEYEFVEEKPVVSNILTYEDIIKNAKISKISTENKFNQASEDFSNSLNEYGFEDEHNGLLLLAQSTNLENEDTNFIVTFKGYLEIHSPYGVVRKGCFDSENPLSLAFIHESEIEKYHLKNGDQLLCACKKVANDKHIVSDILAVNGCKICNWNKNRGVFKNLAEKKNKNLVRISGMLSDAVKRFGIYRGDNIFINLSSNSPKHSITSEIIYNCAMAFDRVVHIKPICNDFEIINDDIARFYTKFEESVVHQIHTALLGINYAKRLVEQGLSVAVIVDDLNSLIVLDNYAKDMIISKTILSSNKNTDNGSLTLFNIIPNIKDTSATNIYEVVKTMQTLSLKLDGKFINLVDSKRV